MAIKLVIAGARGKMGSEVVQMVKTDPTLKLMALLDYKSKKMSEEHHVPIYSNLETCKNQVDFDVIIDFTNPQASFEYIKSALTLGFPVVSGTTGFSRSQLKELEKIANQQKVGCIITPNFSIGAALMVKFAKIAANYFSDVEIIDKHHDQKIDVPSGTAIHLSEAMKEVRKNNNTPGISKQKFPIHSIRLPGYLAHHKVIFGNKGQVFTIKHDSMERISFMDGLKYAVQRVFEYEHLVYGLEEIIMLDER